MREDCVANWVARRGEYRVGRFWVAVGMLAMTGWLAVSNVGWAAEVPFADPVELTEAVPWAREVYIADFDGDGDGDILTFSSYGPKIAWFENRLNESTADFGPRQTIETPEGETITGYPADLDGDGDPDIAAGSREGQKLFWIENRLTEASADFAPSRLIQDYAERTGFPSSIHAVDADGDGDLDLFVANNSAHADVFENRLNQAEGDFTFYGDAGGSGRMDLLKAGDFDGDGDGDVVAVDVDSRTIEYYSNQVNTPSNNFVFVENIAEGAREIVSIDVSDLDRDGDLDVVAISQYDDSISWYENRLNEVTADFGEAQVIPAATSGLRHGLVTDIDGDEYPDVLIGAYNSTDGSVIAWLENLLDQSTPGFGPRRPVSTVTSSPQWLAAGDLDRDANPEILSVSVGQNHVTWFENRLNETGPDFGPPTVITTSVFFPREIAVADLDLDGDLDPVTFSPLCWFPNRLREPTHDFASQRPIRDIAGDIYSVADVDLTLDSVPDLVVASKDNGLIWLENRLHQPSTDFAPPRTIDPQGTIARSIHVTDVNHDGDLDVVTLDGTRIYYYENRLNEGTHDFSTRIDLGGAFWYGDYTLADLDGDDALDLLFSQTSGDTSGRILYRLNPHGAYLAETELARTSIAPVLIRAADLDRDGDADVIAASRQDAILWYENRLNQPPPRFSEARVLVDDMGAAISDLELVDLDRDGDPDLLAGPVGGPPPMVPSLVWYENRLTEPENDFAPPRVITTKPDAIQSVVAAPLDIDWDFDLLVGSSNDRSFHFIESLLPAPLGRAWMLH